MTAPDALLDKAVEVMFGTEFGRARRPHEPLPASYTFDVAMLELRIYEALLAARAEGREEALRQAAQIADIWSGGRVADPATMALTIADKIRSLPAPPVASEEKGRGG